jgi:dipeptidyl aminopeptidase/acylaminoacyl peptidase
MPQIELKSRAARLSKAQLFCWTLLAFGAPAALRPLAPADLFRIEKFGDMAASPDGKWLAYVQIRGKSTANFHMRDFMNGLDRADLWVAAMDGGQPRNVTGGAADGSGWFAPAWSPDGRRLAALSTRGGAVRLWVWERATLRWKLVSKQNVKMAPAVWLSSNELLCAGMADGANPEAFTMEVGAAEAAMNSWPKAWRGTVPTSSVLTSGLEEAAAPRAGQLWKFDLTRDKATPLLAGDFSGITPAPGGRRIAMLQSMARTRPDPREPLPNRNPVKYRLVVYGDSALQADDVVPGSLRWSRGGKLVLQSRSNRRPGDWVVAGGSPLTAQFRIHPSQRSPSARGPRQ